MCNRVNWDTDQNTELNINMNNINEEIPDGALQDDSGMHPFLNCNILTSSPLDPFSQDLSKSATTMTTTGSTSSHFNISSPSLSQSQSESLLLLDPVGEEAMYGMKKGDEFPTWMFENVTPEVVNKIPEEINGTCFYKVNASPELWSWQMADRHNFVMQTSSSVNFEGVQKIGWCRGSFVCCNPNCPFLLTNLLKKPNTNSWMKCSSKTGKQCFSCSNYAV